MKIGSIFLLSLVCLTISAQSHGRRDNLRDLIRVHRKEGSIEYDSEYASGEYSPVYIGIQDGLKDADRITALPGQPDVNISHYSGYVDIDPIPGKSLFYYFVESEDSSAKALVLWLNGGPGCSSFGSGAMSELGPFRVNPDGKTLWQNTNAWNNAANVLFLDSPAGVGFSYSNKTSDLRTGDRQTAADSYAFLLNWLERFPEYKDRDFYLTGEQYAGHYVPQLAALILQNNGITNQTVINLKGIAIGNAFIDPLDTTRGTFDYYYGHALISDEIYDGILQNCNLSSALPPSEACVDFQDQAYIATEDLDGYNIYAPLCEDSSSSSSSSSNSSSVSGFDPCTDDYVIAYLNTPDVQKALHANVTGTIPGPWDTCGGDIQYNFSDFHVSVIPTIKEVMASGIKVWIYSGDLDSFVPVTATKYSLDKIGATVKTPWYPWYIEEEVGGYAVEYQNITFVTVRGAGHYVPSYQPERALVMFSSFLAGKLPPGGT